MKRLKKRIVCCAVIVLLVAGIGGAVWYQKLTHFDTEFTSYIKRVLSKEQQSLLYISDLQAVDHIEITNGDQLKYINKFPNLRSVKISNTLINLEDMNKYLSSISKLQIWKSEIKDQDKQSTLSNLKEIRMEGVPLSSSKFLEGMSGLELFQYDTYDATEGDYLKDEETIDISFIKNYRNLKELRLGRHKYTNTSFIHELSKLNTLVITGESLEEKIDWKDNLVLETLNIYNMTQKAFDNILGVKNIKNLTMILFETPAINISGIDQLTNLQKVYISGQRPVESTKYKLNEYSKPRVKGYESLYNIKALNDVRVYRCNVDFKFPKPEN